MLESPSELIWSTIVRNMPSGHYANKLSSTLKSFMFASARSDCPDFLFEILIEEGQRMISMLCRLDIGHTKMRFKLVKILNFYRLLSLKRQFFESRRNPSSYLKKNKTSYC